MDPGQLLTLAIAAVAVVFGPRLVLRSVGTAGDAVAQLFVPPDRSLGWPHGVQESDTPWGWGVASPDPAPVVAPAGLDPSSPDDVMTSPDLDVIDAPLRTGSFVVPVQRVRPD